MRIILLAGLFAILIIAGCVSTPSEGGQTPPPSQPGGKTCRTVTEEVPVVKEECGPVSYTEQVCGIRKLNYSFKLLPKVDLCIGDGSCTGNPLGDCQACSKAMTRCIMEITNLEPQKTGLWSVGANYTLGSAGFLKDPIIHTIGPNQTAQFDFNQIYTPGQPINSASCSLFVLSEPTIEDCHEETRSRQDCRNVTRTTQVQREVCE